eukprot:338663_1
MSLFASSQTSAIFNRLSLEFQQQCTFQSLVPQNSSPTSPGVLKNIDKQIIAVLNEVMQNNLPFDVAFIRINVLIYYATVTIPSAIQNIFIDYYTFLFYFVISTCMRYTSDLLWFAESEHCECRALFEYLIHVFLPNVNKRSIQYKHCDTTRDAIIQSLMSHGFAMDIAVLIADFTQLECQEFLVTMACFCEHWQCDPSHAGKQWLDYCHFNDLDQGESAFIIPKLLILSLNKININDTKLNDLMFFANQMLIRSVSLFEPKYRIEMLSNLFGNHVSIKAWQDADGFLDLLESIQMIFNQNEAYIVKVIAKSMEDNHLLIFSNCNSDWQMHIDKACATKYLTTATPNIDSITRNFIPKYCVQNQQILKHLYTQIMHCVGYIDSNDVGLSRGGYLFCCKLRDTAVFVLEHFEDETFDQVPFSRFAFEKFKQLNANIIQMQRNTNVEHIIRDRLQQM